MCYNQHPSSSGGNNLRQRTNSQRSGLGQIAQVSTCMQVRLCHVSQQKRDYLDHTDQPPSKAINGRMQRRVGRDKHSFDSVPLSTIYVALIQANELRND
eukprot:5687827-Amphidinium_carterae.1